MLRIPSLERSKKKKLNKLEMERAHRTKRKVFVLWNGLRRARLFREHKLRERTCRRWRAEVAKNEMAYFWTKSIVIGLVDGVCHRNSADIQVCMFTFVVSEFLI